MNKNIQFNLFSTHLYDFEYKFAFRQNLVRKIAIWKLAVIDIHINFSKIHLYFSEKKLWNYSLRYLYDWKMLTLDWKVEFWSWESLLDILSRSFCSFSKLKQFTKSIVSIFWQSLLLSSWCWISSCFSIMSTKSW